MKRILIATICSIVWIAPAAAWWLPGLDVYASTPYYYNYGGYYATPYVVAPPTIVIQQAPIIIQQPVYKRPVAKPQCQKRTICEDNVCKPATICP